MNHKISHNYSYEFNEEQRKKLEFEYRTRLSRIFSGEAYHFGSNQGGIQSVSSRLITQEGINFKRS